MKRIRMLLAIVLTTLALPVWVKNTTVNAEVAVGASMNPNATVIGGRTFDADTHIWTVMLSLSAPTTDLMRMDWFETKDDFETHRYNYDVSNSYLPLKFNTASEHFGTELTAHYTVLSAEMGFEIQQWWWGMPPGQIIRVHAGDTITISTVLHGSDSTGAMTGWEHMRILINDTDVVLDTVINSGHLWVVSLGIHGSWTQNFEPELTKSDTLDALLFDPAENTSGIEATWGFRTENKIPPMGSITDITLTSPMGSPLSSNGNVFDRIGTAIHEYEIRDSHSLDTVNPLYASDNTFITTSREITVRTSGAPMMSVAYGLGATPGLHNTLYMPTGNLPCGGREGWTNQPLDITVDAGVIEGTFDTVLHIPTRTPQNVAVTNAPVTEANYNTSSAGESGTEIYGVLTEIGDISNRLSGLAPRTIKIDTQNPVPGATYDEDFVFTDESYDTLSGLRDGESTIAIFASSEGVTNPPLGAFTSFEEVDITADGEYDVWVRAIDNAGNVGIRRVFVGLDITGVGGEPPIIIPPDPPEPPITPPDWPDDVIENGSITVHKFKGTSLTDAVGNFTGEELDLSDADHPLNNGYEPLEGAEFTLYRLEPDQMRAVQESLTTTNLMLGHTIVLDAVGIPTVHFTTTDGVPRSAIGVIYAREITDAAGMAIFGNNDLANGYYVLVETDTPTGFLRTAPSMIRMPLTDRDGNLNHDIHVYPKNISSTGIANKDINGLEKPVSHGDIVDFELKGQFNSATVSSASDLRSGTAYGKAEIQEIFNEEFRYMSSSLRVYLLDASLNRIATSLPSTHYTVVDAAGAVSGGSITVNLNALGIDAAIDAGAMGFAVTLQATYIGVPSVGIGIDPSTVSNQMNATMTAPGGIDEVVTDTVYVPSLSIVVDKVTSEDVRTPLDGVVFALAKVQVPQVSYVPGTLASAFTQSELDTFAANYVVDETGVPLTITTDATGYIAFSQLDGYDNATGITFYLKELQTKSGYRLKMLTIPVEFDTKLGYQATWGNAWFDDADNWREGVEVTENVRVVNYRLDEDDIDEPGFRLPLTGGRGTILFSVVGLTLMLGVCVICVRGKKAKRS